ncbi:hypothetical protein AAZX31_U042200 [Glycine max]
MSSNLIVQGLRIKNSPRFYFKFDGYKNVHIESIYITAPKLSPNTDGIHIENTNDVKIYSSIISNVCNDVDIKNITCGPGHGIRMTLLLGPPGSGKTTLLLALAGKQPQGSTNSMHD